MKPLKAVKVRVKRVQYQELYLCDSTGVGMPESYAEVVEFNREIQEDPGQFSDPCAWKGETTIESIDWIEEE